MPRGIRNTDAGNGNSNGHKWGQIQEVQVSEVPPMNRGNWAGLYDDLLLRLEQTSERFALAVPVADKKSGTAASASIRKMFERHPGPQSVNLAIREKNSQVYLYVWRGPAWPSK